MQTTSQAIAAMEKIIEKKNAELLAAREEYRALVSAYVKEKKKNPQFLVVYHFWFVDSLGFQYELIERENYKMAKEYADAQAHRRATPHKDCAAFVIEL